MITDSELKNLLETRYPTLNINIHKSGVALWAYVNDGVSNYYQFQLTPSNGVGFSVIEHCESDMSGHDDAFDDLESALNYMDTLLSS